MHARITALMRQTVHEPANDIPAMGLLGTAGLLELPAGEALWMYFSGTRTRAHHLLAQFSRGVLEANPADFCFLRLSKEGTIITTIYKEMRPESNTTIRRASLSPDPSLVARRPQSS